MSRAAPAFAHPPRAEPEARRNPADLVQFAVEARARNRELKSRAETLRGQLPAAQFEIWSALCVGPVWRDARGFFRIKGRTTPLQTPSVRALVDRGLAHFDSAKGPHGALILAWR